MSIVLYEHNQKAYEEALLLMQETKKAAIIHPTGTGKSFIAFRLAQDYPQKRICWLSPSEYIFETQIENIRAVDSYFEADNIQFFTYAKLMLMNQENIAAIKPDYIIFDEFHRCGASEWGKGVERLLETFTDARILGLSATNIRYLDNQRDMADELFDGNVASYMSLGEAIARNILLPPKYIISIYSYQKELDRYQQRIRTAKKHGIRDMAGKRLEALRRALEQAEGLDVVFNKHIPVRQGKYIVFCAGKEHMDEMISHAPEWFGSIDPVPNIYALYAEDPSTSKSFENFKNDNSDHLKLLFCIDMLNEGVHVKGIDGVILFRPTVSPIIYKQQIGRALSASKSQQPIIFDIVNNFDNLTSIGAIQAEMDEVVWTYRDRGEARGFNKTFEVIDEVRDCRKLFAELQQALDVSWNTLYAEARDYYRHHGNLRVPKRYKTKNHLSLGNWIVTQRKVRSGKAIGVLSQEQIARLDAIGMVWEARSEYHWNMNYAQAKRYFEMHANLDVRADYIAKDGFALGKWIRNLRTWRSQGKLSTEQVEQLNAIGMIWNRLEHDWQKNYHAAHSYFLANGHLNVPAGHVTDNGLRLGRWISGQRDIRRGVVKGAAELTPERIALLDDIGMIWRNRVETQWEQMYAEAERYFETHGNLDVLTLYVTESGKALGKWIQKQKLDEKAGALSAARIEKLNVIGMTWAKDPWEERYRLAKAFYEANGHLYIPHQYKTKDGICLGYWLYRQQRIYRGRVAGKALSEEQIEKLNAITMSWHIASRENQVAGLHDDLCAPASTDVS